MDGKCEPNETKKIDGKSCECIKKLTGFKCVSKDKPATSTTEQTSLKDQSSENYSFFYFSDDDTFIEF